MFKRINHKLLFILALTTALLLALTSIALAAVWTDQADYSPGSEVTISGDNSDGAGYLPGEMVHVDVVGPNGYEAECNAVADDNGAWSCQVTLASDESAVGEYSYKATGQSSGVSQSGMFTDATPHNVNFATSGLPGGVSIHIDWSKYNPGNGNYVTGSTTFTSPGPSADEGAWPGTEFTYSGYPTSVTVGSDTYNLSGTSPASGFTTGAAGGRTTVTGTYEEAAPQKQDQTITIITGAPTSAAYGDSFTVEATANSGLQVIYASSGGCTNVNDVFTMISSIEACTVTYNQGGNEEYNAAPQQTETVTATKREITVTSDTVSKIYGEDDPPFTWLVTSGSLAFSDNFIGALTRVSGENVGSYAITQGTLALGSNYDLTFVGANLTITTRPITVAADPQTKIYGDADPALTYQITSGSLVGEDAFTGALTRAAGENVGPYAITQGTLALSDNYDLTFVGANLTITPRPIEVTAEAKTKVLNGPDPELTYQITSGTLVGSDAFSGALTREEGEDIGTYAILQGTLTLGSNYTITYIGANLTITYASDGMCDAGPGHVILQPINQDGTSVFKQKSTVPAKFRVCDYYGNSIGTQGVVTSFRLLYSINGTTENVDEAVVSTTPDTAFRWSSSDQLWIFNINTKNLSSGRTYLYRITLKDNTWIDFQFGLK
jgi:hypothetical protein